MKIYMTALAGLALMLAACSGGTVADPTPEPERGGAGQEAGPVEGEGLVKPWGAEVELGGLTVRVDRPEAFRAENTGAVPAGYEAVLIPITATNTGAEAVAPYHLYFGGMSGGRDVVRFSEYEGSEFNPIRADILPGATAEWTQPAAVADLDDITLQIDYGEGTLAIEETVYVGDAAE